jgi:hypothetical protein
MENYTNFFIGDIVERIGKEYPTRNMFRNKPYTIIDIKHAMLILKESDNTLGTYNGWCRSNFKLKKNTHELWN